MSKTDEITAIAPDVIQLELAQANQILRYLDEIAIATEKVNATITDLHNTVVETTYRYEVAKLASEKLKDDGASKDVVHEAKANVVETKRELAVAKANHTQATRVASILNQNRINALVAMKAPRP